VCPSVGSGFAIFCDDRGSKDDVSSASAEVDIVEVASFEGVDGSRKLAGIEVMASVAPGNCYRSFEWFKVSLDDFHERLSAVFAVFGVYIDHDDTGSTAVKADIGIRPPGPPIVNLLWIVGRSIKTIGEVVFFFRAGFDRKDVPSELNVAACVDVKLVHASPICEESSMSAGVLLSLRVGAGLIRHARIEVAGPFVWRVFVPRMPLDFFSQRTSRKEKMCGSC